MKIGFVSENGFWGKVPEDFDNARTEYCWMFNLDALHAPLNSQIYGLDLDFDLIVLIIPKKVIPVNNKSFVEILKKHSKGVAVMQEGSFWNFQDMDLQTQIWYSNEYASADYIFCHNESDAKYYRGIYDKTPVMVLRSAMIPHTIKDIIPTPEDKTIIGGNFCSWYGGFDSYMVAQEFKNGIYAPAMGRKKDGEEQLLNILPYMNWVEWMKTLSQFKYAVHLMRTFGAGTFAMNCGYFSIPCIGYNGLDTQEYIHPHTSVDLGDIESARQIARKLKSDSDFYNECSVLAKQRSKRYSDKMLWLENFQTAFSRSSFQPIKPH